MKEEFDFESIKNKAIEQLKAGKPLLGKDGAFAPLLESILNAALDGEMDAYPEAAFFNVGTIEDVVAKAKALEKQEA